MLCEICQLAVKLADQELVELIFCFIKEQSASPIDEQDSFENL
jgi:hypothetical protein